jgi:hypothetical protein
MGAACELIHVDVKTLSRLRKVGHVITGDREMWRYFCSVYGKVHLAVGDIIRLDYVQVLANE